jgi:DNA-binding MarR family transcriptional regulator
MNEALRSWHTAFSELGRQFAAHLGVHSSDAAALMQITAAEDRGAPLTQTQLAKRIGLTTPATSSLLNRLEDGGHIERHRSRADRRVVTLRSTRAMHDEVHRYFRVVGNDIDLAAAEYSDDTIDRLTSLITDMTKVLDRYQQKIGEGQA